MAARTRKWAFVQQEAKRLTALGLSVREIAQRLEIDPSTITRWRKDGKLPRGQRTKDAPATVPVLAVNAKTPAEWAASVRSDYQLDATDDQLVTVAEHALGVSLNPEVSAQVQMSAAGRFQAIVRQLALVARAQQAAADNTPKPDAVEPSRPKNPAVKRKGTGDPRGILEAVVNS